MKTSLSTFLFAGAALAGAGALDAQFGGHGLDWLEDLCLPGDEAAPADMPGIEMAHESHASLFWVVSLASTSLALFLGSADARNAEPMTPREKAILALIVRVAIANGGATLAQIADIYRMQTGRTVSNDRIRAEADRAARNDSFEHDGAPFRAIADAADRDHVLATGFATGYVQGDFRERAIVVLCTAAHAMGMGPREVEAVHARHRLGGPDVLERQERALRSIFRGRRFGVPVRAVRWFENMAGAST